MKFIDNFITNWFVNRIKLGKTLFLWSIGYIIIPIEVICAFTCVILPENSIWIIPWAFVIIFTIFVSRVLFSYEDSLDCIKVKRCIDYTFMPFDSWKDINPDSWEWGNLDYTGYGMDIIQGVRTKKLNLEHKNQFGYIIFREWDRWDYYYIYFSFLDYLKFKRFSKKIDKQKELLWEENRINWITQKETNTLKTILNKAQNEIDELRKQSCEELNKGSNIVKNVCENLKG